MSIVTNLISLIESSSSLSGFELPDIQSLVARIHVSDTNKLVHYSLVNKWILELTFDKANIYDIDLNDMKSLSDIPDYIHRLAFRVGKSFGDSRIESKINSILSNYYVKHKLDGFEFYVHKDSVIDVRDLSNLISNLRQYGKFQVLDRMFINSIFGDIFYWRDR